MEGQVIKIASFDLFDFDCLIRNTNLIKTTAGSDYLMSKSCQEIVNATSICDINYISFIILLFLKRNIVSPIIKRDNFPWEAS